jgi:poly(hydroxyalkanoate) depolymerase family esterase
VNSRKISALFCLALTVFSLGSTKAEGWIDGHVFNFYGARNYHLYLPEGHLPHKTYPLVIALHGCLQDPKSFAGGARLKQYADRYQAIVVIPNQHSIYNPYKCWNWFNLINQGRSGEPAIIVSLVEQLKERYLIDSDRVYAMGMSAGAAIANTLGNCYPEHFRAIAGHHGVQHKATENPMLAQDVFYRGPKISPIRAAEKGYQCQGSEPRLQPMPALTIQGDRGIMDPSNSRAIENQFLAFNDLLNNGRVDNSTKLDRTSTLITHERHYDYEVISWRNPLGQRIVERVEIIGLGHSWSGGDNNYDWNDPGGPEATGLIFEFFEHHGL